MRSRFNQRRIPYRRLVLFWKDVGELEFELLQKGLQFIEGEVMFALFDAEQGHGRETGSFTELGIGQFSSSFTQVVGELTVQTVSHPKKVAKPAYRM